MSARRRAWARNDEGVSEVVGYLLGLGTAFLLLVATIYAYSTIGAGSRRFGATAELQDVANRVAQGVQESLLIANNRLDTAAGANSSLIRFNHSLTVAPRIQGWNYEVRLDANYVNASLREETLSVSIPTFNSAVIVAGAGASCKTTSLLCELAGTGQGSSGQIVVSYHYEYVSAPGNPLNRITIA